MAMKKEPPEVEKSILCQQSQSGACYFDHHFYKFVYFSNVKEKPMTFTEQAKDQAQASWQGVFSILLSQNYMKEP